MKIIYSEDALDDLKTIQLYYAEQLVPVVGKKLLREILARVQRLNDHPFIGRKVPEYDDENKREIIHSPFRIVYEVEDERIQVIRIWRSERLLKLPEVKPYTINESIPDYQKKPKY